MVLAFAMLAACRTGSSPSVAKGNPGAAPRAEPRLDPEIFAMLSKVSERRMIAAVKMLVSCGTRNSCSVQLGPDKGIGLRRLAAVFLQPVGIALVVPEMQRILGHLGSGDQLVSPLVEQGGKALLRTHAHMMAALRADAVGGDQIAVEDHLAAAGAFAPQIVRGRCRGAAHQPFNPWTDEIGNPIHD